MGGKPGLRCVTLLCVNPKFCPDLINVMLSLLALLRFSLIKTKQKQEQFLDFNLRQPHRVTSMSQCEIHAYECTYNDIRCDV